MSNIFSFHRFMKLFLVTFREDIKLILIPFAIFMLLLIWANYTFVSSDIFSSPEAFKLALQSSDSSVLSAAWDIMKIVLLIAIVSPIVLCALTSKCFNAYNKRSKATFWMMLPCSQLEKFLVPFVLYVLMIPLLYTVVMLITELITFGTLNEQINLMDLVNEIASTKGTTFAPSLSETLVRIVICSFFFYASGCATYFLGASMFKSLSFLFSTIFVVVCWVFLLCMGCQSGAVPQFVNMYILSNEGTPSETVINLTYIAEIVLLTIPAWFFFKRRTLP